MKKYKHLFFDLDGTIWDFETNSIETLNDIYHKYSLKQYFDNFEVFVKTYHKHNDKLWAKYREGKIEKKVLNIQRFLLTTEEAGLTDYEIAKEIAHDYITISPTKKKLFPYAHEILTALQKEYKLHIITNGFSEVQFLKLENSNLTQYFTEIIISEKVGIMKPAPKIFEHSLNLAGAKKPESIMIGDNLEVDILAAANFGIDQVYFNPGKKPHNENITFEINSLIKLSSIIKTF
jgi:putative hydrolase of the HAD superfamily